MSLNPLNIRTKFDSLDSRTKRLIGAAGMILVIFVIGEIVLVNYFGFANWSFFSIGKFLVTTKLAAIIALFGLCQMIVIAGGNFGFDLSVISNATLSAIITTLVMDGSNANILPAVLVAIALGAAIGAVNGLLAAYLNLPALIATMGMSYILQGIINAYSTNMSIGGDPSPAVIQLAAKTTGSFPNIIFLMIILVVVMWLLISKSKIGTILLSVGANDAAARLCGINVKKVRWLTYFFSGITAALVGIILVGNLGTPYKTMAADKMILSVVSVVVGGISIKGGEANYLGVFLGAIVLQSVSDLFVTFGWSEGARWLGYGIILFGILSLYVRSIRSR